MSSKWVYYLSSHFIISVPVGRSVGETDYQIVTQIHVLAGFPESQEGRAQCFLRGSCLTLLFREGFSEDRTVALSSAGSCLEGTVQSKAQGWESIWIFRAPWGLQSGWRGDFVWQQWWVQLTGLGAGCLWWERKESGYILGF